MPIARMSSCSHMSTSRISSSSMDSNCFNIFPRDICEVEEGEVAMSAIEEFNRGMKISNQKLIRPNGIDMGLSCYWGVQVSNVNLGVFM